MKSADKNNRVDVSLSAFGVKTRYSISYLYPQRKANASKARMQTSTIVSKFSNGRSAFVSLISAIIQKTGVLYERFRVKTYFNS